MVSNSERTKILEMIESGTITAEEGLTLLKALGETDEQDDDSPLLNEAPCLQPVEVDAGGDISA